MTSNSPPLPLTIISGYLGSGKTTLVNHLLRNANGRRLMVLVNDFGELPIDADLIESQDGDTINLANGCACCSMGGDLFNALVDVLDMNPSPDHLLIEASGVADPAKIANIALAEPDLKLDATISLVDGETFEAQVEDKLIGETLSHQLASSDIILLNKLDLIDKNKRDRLEVLLAKISPDATRIETEFSRVPIEFVIGVELDGHLEKETLNAAEDHAAGYSKWSIMFDTPLDRGKIICALESLGKDVLRLKGFVELQGEEGVHIVQFVGGRHAISRANFSSRTDYRTGLVAIGLSEQLDKGKLNATFGNGLT